MTDEETKTAREKTVQTRRELIGKMEFLLHKGFEQSYEVDKSLLTLSGGALLLSITFVGTLSETKHCVGLLFVAWACFVASITAVIFAMWKAQLRTHSAFIGRSQEKPSRFGP